MKHPSVPSVRRVAFAAALAGLALAGVGAASAAAPCAASALTVWLGVPGNQTAGSTYYPLEFSNTGTATCTLHGYPAVSAVTAAGGALGSPAGQDASSTPATVTLKPGATAHTELQITDVDNYPPASCGSVTAFGLQVTAPNQTAGTEIAYAFPACSTAGPVYLHVTPIVAGVGIPGYGG